MDIWCNMWKLQTNMSCYKNLQVQRSKQPSSTTIGRIKCGGPSEAKEEGVLDAASVSATVSRIISCLVIRVV